MSNSYDILIVGGGLTGASLACALANKPLRIGIIDSVVKTPILPTLKKTDLRALALSHVSQRIFTGLGLWSAIKPYATPIKEIHISDRGRFGFTRINAKQHKLDAVGNVVAMDYLNYIVYQALASNRQIDMIAPATVEALSFNEQNKTVSVNLHDPDNAKHEKALSAKLIVAADGGNSSVRRLLNINTRIWDYHQTAITTNIGLATPHNNVAFERFTESGPIALLPCGDKEYAVVWTLPHDQAERIMQLNDEEIVSQIQQYFGYRLGKFTWVGPRQSFPLRLVRAEKQVYPHVALIGNASHTLHPIAGQGFNLGLRDVAVLAQLIADNVAAGGSLTDNNLLQNYSKQRVWDQRIMIGLTDSLVRLFSNNYQPLSLLRNMALVGLDLLPGIKQQFTRRTMGFSGVMPNLTLGIPI